MKAFPHQQFIFPKLESILEIRTTLDSTLPYAEHFHSSFSFGLILDGQTRFFLGKEAHLAEAGDIVLIAPEQVHSCNPVEKSRAVIKWSMWMRRGFMSMWACCCINSVACV